MKVIPSRVRTFIRHKITRHLTSRVDFENPINVLPISSIFGIDRGTPLDRIYINRFLKQHSHSIRGNCLEVEDIVFTRKFGRPNHVPCVLRFTPTEGEKIQNELVADLTKPETLPESRFDTFICTQTLNFIFDLEPVINSIYKLLKPGGNALITVAGISQISRYDYERWGDYWRFTDKSLRKLLTRTFAEENCEIVTYGNVATSCLFLQGVSYEDIPDKKILDVTDPSYQMVVCAIVTKE
jgi:hypothetical protein